MKQFVILLILFAQTFAIGQTAESEVPTVEEFEVLVSPENIETGFFETYEDFIANKPITGINVKKQKRSNEERLHLKDADTRKKIKHFAYYDGETLHVNAFLYSLSRYYVKAEWFNDFIMFHDVFENADTAEDLSLAFGLIGALASNQQQMVFINLKTSYIYTITKGNLIRLIKELDEELFNIHKHHITEPHVLKLLLHHLNKEMGKEALEDRLFED